MRFAVSSIVSVVREAGVFGVLPGIIGTIQAVEALKVLLDVGEPLIGNLLLFDALSMDFTGHWKHILRLKLRQNSDCPMCGENPTITDMNFIDYEEFCEVRW